ncbi:MAG: hypothetical protein Q7U53_18315 [Anaerolineaceae bacterium]|nr:hypothetical protein [Anaerolineaceae bacterium]
MHKWRLEWLIWIFALLVLMIPVASVPAISLQSSSVSLLSPSNCPLGGCAAGQRLNFRSTFDLLSYLPSQNTNIQMCLYTPANWSVTQVGFNQTGKLSGAAYISDTSNCGTGPTDYVLSGGLSTALNSSFFGEALDFYFRLGNTASTNGSALVRVNEFNGSVWSQTGQSFNFISVTPVTNEVYVVENSTGCGSNTPCYVNSADDELTGVGTGLKDAVDAVASGSTINIKGYYPIKSNTVVINKSVVMQGFQNSTLSTNSLICTQPMLSLQNGITIQNLSINDGFCSLVNRDLIVVNSLEDINILSNNFFNGKDAISVISNQGKITIQFNNISNNSGYAINKPNASGNGQMVITANNILSNRSGVQVNCNNLGLVDHNFWGIGILPGTATSNCTSQAGKRLGSAIIDNLNNPGVQAALITVTSTKSYYFENSIAVQRPVTNPDNPNFDIFIVNHGNNSINTPFLNSGALSTLVPCNNFYDIFLAQGLTNNPELNIFMKYDLNAACIANVESTTYCGQSNSALFPLWWYDPEQLVTTGWNTTGQAPNGPSAGGVSGQVTTCSLPNKEISVQIDATGRPGINNDLTFTPFVVGLVGQPAAAVLSSFTAVPGNMQITINWKTTSELNTSGFYVQRRPTGTLTFSRVSPFVIHTGTDTAGATYSFIDNNVTNLTAYDYRLEIVGINLLSVYSNILSATPIPPTITPSITLTQTITQTPTITQTLITTITTTPTISLTPTITQTSTITPTPTRTRFRTATNTRTPFLIPYRSPTRTFAALQTSSSGYPAPTTGQTNPTSQGYPIVTNDSSQSENGYPAPGESTQQSGGYPGPEIEESEGTIIPSEGTPGFTPKPQLSPSVSTTKSSIPSSVDRNTNWIYPLLGSIIGLSLVLLVGYFLWKKGYMALPIRTKKDRIEIDEPDK